MLLLQIVSFISCIIHKTCAQANISQVNSIRTKVIVSPKIEIKLNSLPAPFETTSARKLPFILNVPRDPVLNVPKGFAVNVFARDLNAPRWLALTPSGDVLVTETPENKITLLRDADGDGVAEVKTIFATKPDNNLNLPLGMAFAPQPNATEWGTYYFFVGNTNEVRRYDYTWGDDKLIGSGVRIAKLPGFGYNQHWTRNVVVSPFKTKIYVSVGSQANVAEEPSPRASVISMNLDGSQQEVVTAGLRNPVGLAFHPATRDLYTTVNERDGLGDDLVPDYFTRIQRREFFGWPYAYLSPKFVDPRMLNESGGSLRPDLVKLTRTPDVLFQAHSAALGLTFYTGNSFPRKYRDGAFAAFRGSWNRHQGTGYKIVYIPFSARTGRPQGHYRDFLTGFLIDPHRPSTWGRPVGLTILRDGSLLITEEMNGMMYRVQFER